MFVVELANVPEYCWVTLKPLHEIQCFPLCSIFIIKIVNDETECFMPGGVITPKSPAIVDCLLSDFFFERMPNEM